MYDRAKRVLTGRERLIVDSKFKRDVALQPKRHLRVSKWEQK
jgi:hypothetical protein